MIKRAATEIFSGACFAFGVCVIVYSSIVFYPEVMLTIVKARHYLGL